MTLPIVFYDTEARSSVPIKNGADRYCRDQSTECIVLTALFPDGTLGLWAPENRRMGLEENLDVPCNEIRDRWNEWVAAGGITCAWNTSFDRKLLTHACPELAAPSIDQSIDAMAMAENFALPGKLSAAAKALKASQQKSTHGKRLMDIFCDARRDWPGPQHQEDLWIFWQYAAQDVRTMVDVFEHCRLWSADEWRDYQVIERINDAGMHIDTEFAAAAAKLAKYEMASIDRELQELTGDRDDPATGHAGITMRHSARKLAFAAGLFGESKPSDDLGDLPVEEPVPEIKLLDVTKYGYQTTDGVRRRVKKTSRSLGKDVRHAIKARMAEGPIEGVDCDRLAAFIDLLDRGSGVAYVKYDAINRFHVDGILRGQFRCSPTQTGRHASRGVQFDNLPRAALEDPKGELSVDGVMGLIVDVVTKHPDSIPALVTQLEARFELPLTEILARLVRPSVYAPHGWSLVWADWSSNEARILLWLAGAEDALKPYRDGEDVYCIAAAAIYPEYTAEEIRAGYKAKDANHTRRRLVGKVATLALGFGGGAFALIAMARSYNLKLTYTEANAIKEAWRAANFWAELFWNELNEAAWAAARTPDTFYPVGQHLGYIRKGTTLYATLPCGRPIAYPDIGVDRVIKERDGEEYETHVLGYRKTLGMTCVRGELYGGLLAENVTQAVGASTLRYSMRQIDSQLADRDDAYMIGSTHDEIRALAREESVHEVSCLIEQAMLTLPEWADGLPMAVEAEKGYYYGK